MGAVILSSAVSSIFGCSNIIRVTFNSRLPLGVSLTLGGIASIMDLVNVTISQEARYAAL